MDPLSFDNALFKVCPAFDYRNRREYNRFKKNLEDSGDEEQSKEEKELEVFLRARKEREEAMNADLMANVS